MPRRTKGHRVLAVMDENDVDRERAIKVFDLDSSDAGRSEEESRPSTPADCVGAIQSWKSRHGRLPNEDEWAAPTEEHPSANEVTRYFGSWKGGLAAAGFPLEPGHRPADRAH